MIYQNFKWHESLTVAATLLRNGQCIISCFIFIFLSPNLPFYYLLLFCLYVFMTWLLPSSLFSSLFVLNMSSFLSVCIVPLFWPLLPVSCLAYHFNCLLLIPYIHIALLFSFLCCLLCLSLLPSPLIPPAGRGVSLSGSGLLPQCVGGSGVHHRSERKWGDGCAGQLGCCNSEQWKSQNLPTGHCCSGTSHTHTHMFVQLYLWGP